MEYKCSSGSTWKSAGEDKDLWIMIHSFNALKRKNIMLDEGIRKSLEHLNNFYEATNDKRYMDVAVLEIKAFLILGGEYFRNKDQFDPILASEGIDLEWLLSRYGIKRIKLNRGQVRGLIRKWMPSRENPAKISEVVDEIMERVSHHQTGRYLYSYKRGCAKESDTDLYELIVEEEDSYFHDITRMQYYIFEREE
jgi:hypothetical protein